VSLTWNDAEPPQEPRFGVGDWLRVAWRGGVIGVITFTCLALLLLVRLFERPIYGLHRPFTPYFAQFVCRMAFVVLGIRYRVTGEIMKHRGAVVANHVSWLDIFTLNARKRIYYVAKAEVAKWPGIGWLARSTGTVFINRDRREAKAQTKVFEARLLAGHKLLFFPEGTSTDGLHMLPFKTTLFAAFFAPELREVLWVQPVTMVYTAPQGRDERFYGWWGEMEFGAHLLKTLAARRQGTVEVVYHPPLRVADFASRKDLAAACEAAVRGGFPEGMLLN